MEHAIAELEAALELAEGKLRRHPNKFYRAKVKSLKAAIRKLRA